MESGISCHNLDTIHDVRMDTAILMSNGNGKIVICSFVREEDNVVLPCTRDSRLASRARDRELETLGVERTVEAVAATSQRSTFQ
ncbi:hypothetical protein NDU88_002303 [Pleurodeles waltl]|uniref:Uncharacterized protein n=1 Tax=Pleurodeles waltl TaxID=8319 RepID=A0AAV7LDS3_PLEWA|nr:hypothetical protein NDU88_002303 [Pleurodeles waltl]